MRLPSSKGHLVRLLSIVSSSLLIAGCSVARTTVHSGGGQPFLCQTGTKQARALILWGTAWRTDQKEKQLREDKAAQAIAAFFATRSCYAKTTVLRTIAGHDPMKLSDLEIMEYSSALPDAFDTIVIIRVEELGPLLMVYLSPILWEGGTEAVLRVRALDPATGGLDADLGVHRRDTGAFVLRGTRHLGEDVEAALGRLFLGQ